jgi:hypothetical protein
MHRSGVATPARVVEARALDERRLAERLAEWGAPAQVWEAAGMVAPPAPSGRQLSDRECQRLVDRHSVAAGIPLSGVWWAHPRTAGKVQLDPEWDARAGTDCPPWALAQGLQWRVARLLARAEAEPAFAPLRDLIEGGVHPYGPTAQGFCLVDPDADHDAPARQHLRDIGAGG